METLPLVLFINYIVAMMISNASRLSFLAKGESFRSRNQFHFVSTLYVNFDRVIKFQLFRSSNKNLELIAKVRRGF